MNSVLQSSVSSIHQDSVDGGRQLNKKSAKKRGAAEIGSDDSDEELSRELRENQA